MQDQRLLLVGQTAFFVEEGEEGVEADDADTTPSSNKVEDVGFPTD